MKLVGKVISDLSIGDTACIEKTFLPDDVEAFGKASLDMNPLHFDEEFAATTRFRRPIIHGILTAGLISAVIGMELPGPGCIYLSQELKFLKPVFIGDRIKAIVTVKELLCEKNICKLDTVCTNQVGDIVVQGIAVVMPRS